MVQKLKYLTFFVFGLIVATFYHRNKATEKTDRESATVVLEEVKDLSKLVVAEASFSEIYAHSDTKNYLFETVQFQKKALLTVNAKVEVGYDLSKMEIDVDAEKREIRIVKIPTQELNISPEIRYFDLQQSTFNSFTKEELNSINAKAILKIRESIDLTPLEKDAKRRLFEELSKLYQLSRIYGWKVVNETSETIPDQLIKG
jgi:hypothetical protein